MFAKCLIKLINNHLILMDNGQNILIDTGSPVSIHPSGTLVIGENEFSVQSNVPCVSPQYISEKVRYEIHGLLGMDIINRMPTFFDLTKEVMLLDDETEYPNHFKKYPINPMAGGFVAITILVNGRNANMIVDSGAPISYIRPEFLSGLECVEILEDFSPFIGKFQTETYDCEVDTLTHSGTYIQRFGIPPQIISMTFDLLQIDGVIGIELFKRYRLQFKDKTIYSPDCNGM